VEKKKKTLKRAKCKRQGFLSALGFVRGFGRMNTAFLTPSNINALVAKVSKCRGNTLAKLYGFISGLDT
jgi:hypothetical protein